MSLRNLLPIILKLDSYQLNSQTELDHSFQKTRRVLERIKDEIDWEDKSDQSKLDYRLNQLKSIEPHNEKYVYLAACNELLVLIIKKIDSLEMQLHLTHDIPQNMRLQSLLAILFLEKEFILEYKNVDQLRHNDYYWFNDILSNYYDDEEVKKIIEQFHIMYSNWPKRPWKEVTLETAYNINNSNNLKSRDNELNILKTSSNSHFDELLYSQIPGEDILEINLENNQTITLSRPTGSTEWKIKKSTLQDIPPLNEIIAKLPPKYR